jgi:hypothetical protein
MAKHGLRLTRRQLEKLILKGKLSVSTPDVEQNFGYASNGAKEIKRLDTPCSIHIHSKRKRLCDPDGVSAKYLIDGLVLAGILQDDRQENVEEVTFSQEKSKEEETIITIYTGGKDAKSQR